MKATTSQKMDRAISRWILIFLAQQRGINCSIFKSLLSVLPLPEDDLLLKKLDLLCRIIFQMDDKTFITEEMLNRLEVIEELDSITGISSIIASLVKDISGRGDLNMSPSLPCENLKRHAPSKIAKGYNRGTRIADADELETETSAAVTGKKRTLQVTRLVKNLFPDAQGVEERHRSSNLVKGSLPDPHKVTESPASDKHTQKYNLEQDVDVAEEQVVVHQSGYVAKNPLPAVHQVNGWPQSDQHKRVSDHGADINTEEEQGLQSRYLVKNPLPDANKETERRASDQHNKKSNLGKDASAAESSLKENNVDSLVPEKSKKQPRGSRELPRYNFRNHNGTAHTYEWEKEGLVGQDEANPSSRPQNKSNPDTRSVKKRRRFRKWSPEEAATVRAGVEKFGEGQWKFILDCYPSSFERRKSNDLKDKWRNLSRYSTP